MGNALRQHILDEIRRIAAENGGRAPGARSFRRAAGIRQSDWRGVYWARWGDAVREAGLEPNSIQLKIKDDVVLGKLAEACRRFGRFPTAAELRMYKRTDPDFPSVTTITGRFGPSANVRQRLSEWAAAGGGRAGLVPLLGKRSVPAEVPSKTEGHVYLIRSGAHSKIGRSGDLERRFKEIRVTLPEAVMLVHAIRTDDPPGIEAYWHRRFAARRAQGEWFKLTAADIAAFKRRKYQ